MKRRDYLVGGLAAALSAGAWSDEAQTAKVIDWPAIRLLDGAILPSASWRGQPAIVVVWATFCPFCKRHNAHVDKLVQQTRGQALRVLGLAIDTDEGLVRKYMASNNYRFPVALDVDLRARLTSRQVIPMTCLIDRQGRLVQAIPGEMFEEDLMELAAALIKRTA